jgi:hypothetical protein
MKSMKLFPVAYQDDVSGRKMIVEIGDSKKYLLLLPSGEPLGKNMGSESLLYSAVAKYGFIPFEKKQPPIECSRKSEG